MSAAAVFALAAPIAGTATTNNEKGGGGDRKTYVAPGLGDKAKKTPNAMIDVIITSNVDTKDAERKTKALGSLAKLGKRLDLVSGVSVRLPAKLVDKLAKVPGLEIVPDAPARSSSGRASSKQLWPHESGVANLWNLTDFGYKMPTIAVVDSGIEKGRTDFGNGARVLADVNLSTLDGNSSGDGRGHGTFVAGIAAGGASGYAGAAPKAPVVSIDVMDDKGMARTSDVIAACDWILKHKDQYNIRVANFSLHSTYPSNFTHDPLDRAVERLWFAGVTVVAAAGNYGIDDITPSGVKYAPGNDPFVITVGAVDLGGTARTKDDKIAHWSAWGYTYDGFRKPEIGAAGRYIVGPVPTASTLVKERPNKVTATGYMELSGTSFSAPIVAGTAAALLARYPHWTPDQVKGALMAGAMAVPKATAGQSGVGQVNAVKAIMISNPPNPNAALNRFVVKDAATGSASFDTVSWYDAATSDVSWDSVSWADVSWSDVSWSDVSWADVSWSDVSWADVSWSDVSWADVSWSDMSREDAVEGEPESGLGGIELDPEDAAEIVADPLLAGDPTFAPATEVLTAAPAAATTTVTTTLP